MGDIIIEEKKGENFIPLAPVWTSTEGITYQNKNGFNGSLRYRFLGRRSANDNYSLVASGYFITDAKIKFSKPKFEIGLEIYNLFNTRWKETQFDTLTKLKGESQPVNEICFTPGTPFYAKFSVAYFFK